MYDGINLQSSLYSLIIIIYLLMVIKFHYFLLLIGISISFFLFLNFNNKSFLGDGGTYLISFILSYTIVKNYNLNLINFADEIFILMMIPGIELLRLALQRISKGMSPFQADREHLHHYLEGYFGIYKTNLILCALVIVPLFLLQYLSNLLVGIGVLIIYLL